MPRAPSPAPASPATPADPASGVSGSVSEPVRPRSGPRVDRMTLTLPGGTADALRDAVYLDALASGRRITQGDAIAALVGLYSRRVARRVAAAGIDPAEALRLRDLAAQSRGGPRVREPRKMGVTYAGAVRLRY